LAGANLNGALFIMPRVLWFIRFCVAVGRIGEVDRMSPQPAPGCLVGERLLLFGEQLRQIRLDPGEIGRQVQPVRPGIQTGCQVQHLVAAVGDRVDDDVIDDLGTGHQPPAVANRSRSRGNDGTAAFARKPVGEWIVEPGRADSTAR
jgi:hypothetical protein